MEPKIASSSPSVDAPDEDKVDTDLRIVANEVRVPQSADSNESKDNMPSTPPHETFRTTPDKFADHQDDASLLDNVSKVSDYSHRHVLVPQHSEFIAHSEHLITHDHLPPQEQNPFYLKGLSQLIRTRTPQCLELDILPKDGY